MNFLHTVCILLAYQQNMQTFKIIIELSHLINILPNFSHLKPLFYTFKTVLLQRYNLILFIYLFLAALGLRCCARAFSSCGEWGLLFVVVRGLLTAVASLVAEHGL